MTATVTLFRPVGRVELDLILRLDYRGFPPRLSHQPIFYPVLTESYAVEIARDWNTRDEASGFVGYVTRFEVSADFLARYPVQTAGARRHQELWVPAEELAEFNRHIVGTIAVIAEYRGESAADARSELRSRDIDSSIRDRPMNDTAAVIDALARAPQIIVPLVREVPPAVLKRRPAPKRWSAHEHACHLAHVHALFFQRLEAMLAEPAAVIKPYQPGDQDADDMLLAMDLDSSLERFVADRARLVARVRELTPEEWSRTATHPEYSAYSVFIMFRHVVLHDFLHGYRIEELLLDPNQGS